MTGSRTDVLIIGAGAAGLMCAIEAGKRGRQVLVVDHARRPGEKIRISGGGRCNFTNLHTTPGNFLSQNPRFCISALARYTPDDFVALVKKHKIAFHEKTLGQLFCDGLSQQIIAMLMEECRVANVDIRLGTDIELIAQNGTGFVARTSMGEIAAESLVVASGGLSVPKMGASGLGYQIARQFGISIVPTQPALVPFTFTEPQMKAWRELAGVSVNVRAQCGKQEFREAMLFTHRGLSGPAMLQISSYWRPGGTLRIDLAPDARVADALLEAKAVRPGQEIATALSLLLPKRLAQRIVEQHVSGSGEGRLGEMSDRQLGSIGCAVNDWRIVPNGTEGYRTAEVTLGGVDTADLSSKTMECRKVPNLYFIGEVVDVTGHLGGFNFQWAWASGFVSGQYV
ncbi:MAG TPA: NAD(P)/FAD-dependent oxidoreductase [Bryobacteraceae bacterium]|nr:NAD(P)/FAD-dependent oxidoreductase [Bryobacteraceae bacterium]